MRPKTRIVAILIAAVLVDRTSPAYLGALGNVTDMTTVMGALVDSFRDGSGVPWAQYGDAARAMQSELNRPGYLTSLAQEWLPARQPARLPVPSSPHVRRLRI